MAVAQWVTAKRADNAWDHLYLDGREIPCTRVEVKGGKVGSRIDIKRRAGEDGAEYSDKGREPAKFSATLYWTTLALAEAAEAVLNEIHPPVPGNTLIPHTITHPSPNEAHISRVLIESTGFPATDQKTKIRSRQLWFTEFAPATPKETTTGIEDNAIGYGDPEEQAQAVADRYNEQDQEILDDLESGRISQDEANDRVLQSNTDRINALRDVATANDQPASPENVDDFSF